MEEYGDMRKTTREMSFGESADLPKANAKGEVPAVEFARASLARKLIRDRRRVGLTQTELARRAGIRAETLCQIEKGKSTPDTAIFNKLHRALEKAERELPETN